MFLPCFSSWLFCCFAILMFLRSIFCSGPARMGATPRLWTGLGAQLLMFSWSWRQFWKWGHFIFRRDWKAWIWGFLWGFLCGIPRTRIFKYETGLMTWMIWGTPSIWSSCHQSLRVSITLHFPAVAIASGRYDVDLWPSLTTQMWSWVNKQPTWTGDQTSHVGMRKPCALWDKQTAGRSPSNMIKPHFSGWNPDLRWWIFRLWLAKNQHFANSQAWLRVRGRRAADVFGIWRTLLWKPMDRG